MMNDFINPKGYDHEGEPRPTPIDMQLRVLGLTEKVLDELAEKKAKVLDIGCGKVAHLVRFLRRRGIDAEGLDFRISEECHEDFLMPYCMPKGITMINERIPRPSNYYDLAISHCMDDFYDSIHVPGSKEQKDLEKFEKTMAKFPMTHVNRSDIAVLEAMRVVFPGGKLVIHPRPTALSNMQKTLEKNNCYIAREKLDNETLRLVSKEYHSTYKWFRKPLRGNPRSRALIYKNQINSHNNNP